MEQEEIEIYIGNIYTWCAIKQLSEDSGKYTELQGAARMWGDKEYNQYACDEEDINKIFILRKIFIKDALFVQRNDGRFVEILTGIVIPNVELDDQYHLYDFPINNEFLCLHIRKKELHQEFNLKRIHKYLHYDRDINQKWPFSIDKQISKKHDIEREKINLKNIMRFITEKYPYEDYDVLRANVLTLIKKLKADK